MAYNLVIERGSWRRRPVGARRYRELIRLRDAWRKDGQPAPRGLRPRWPTYQRAAQRAGVTIWPPCSGRRFKPFSLPAYFVINGLPFAPYR